jgi:hypothetical protein
MGRKRERSPVHIGICYSHYREQRLARMGGQGETGTQVRSKAGVSGYAHTLGFATGPPQNRDWSGPSLDID